ncbi:MAG: CUAEP/CCAEP-tail radical SAM (seleno)protein [Actinomycetota bacterium]
MRVLLLSTYELGHQPLHVASPAGALREAGHEVRCLDLSIEKLDAEAVAWAHAAGISVPMHTAMRLGIKAAELIKSQRPELPVCFYGLYAPVGRDATVGMRADRVIAGEYEQGLGAWVDRLARGAHADAGSEEELIQLGHDPFVRPARDLLPGLDGYAHLAMDGGERMVGYVEASHGCAHECRHCPVPVVYGGRIRLVPADVVIADIDQLVDMGAEHITFGDPDFLNGWRHSLRIVRALHERWPHLTFDITTKVEHVLERRDLWAEMAESGCLFVVCALETTNDVILERLDKGHTTAQAIEAIRLLRAHGIEIRPSFLPFTPWTTRRDMADLLNFVVAQDLIANVDVVQYAIRLLLPEGSLLLSHPDLQPYLGPYDPEHLTYTWRSEDEAIDYLQRKLARIVEHATDSGDPPGATFLEIYRVVMDVAGADDETPADPIEVGSVEGRPRLTEPWFC